jgi:hypothetical protein
MFRMFKEAAIVSVAAVALVLVGNASAAPKTVNGTVGPASRSRSSRTAAR